LETTVNPACQKFSLLARWVYSSTEDVGWRCAGSLICCRSHCVDANLLKEMFWWISRFILSLIPPRLSNWKWTRLSLCQASRSPLLFSYAAIL